jgi:hypothetical protein
MIPDFHSLLELGSERAVADMIVDVIGHEPDRFKAVLDICFTESYPVSMRAARVIQLYCEENPGAILPYLDEVVAKTIASDMDGVKRSFLKVFAECIDIRLIREQGPLLNTCFNWLADARETPAVRVHCMEIIYKLSLTEPDLQNELKASIEFIFEEKKPSLTNRGAKMLKKLRRQSETL